MDNSIAGLEGLRRAQEADAAAAEKLNRETDRMSKAIAATRRAALFLFGSFQNPFLLFENGSYNVIIRFRALEVGSRAACLLATCRIMPPATLH